MFPQPEPLFEMRSLTVSLCPVVLFIKAFSLKGHRFQYIIVWVCKHTMPFILNATEREANPVV